MDRRRSTTPDSPNEYGGSLDHRMRSLNILTGTATAAHKIIVGVDFGTTYTGVSWITTDRANTKTLDDVHVISDWPGPTKDADTTWKTPSRIAYAEDNELITKDAWGFGVTSRLKSYCWMKLLLDPGPIRNWNDPSLQNSEGAGVLQLPPNTSAVSLCADYLQHVALFAHQSLVKQISAETLAVTPLDLYFTVPAVWSDKAKADTLRAAIEAATMAQIKTHPQTRIYLIAEPEAAAIAVISDLARGVSASLVKPGSSSIVCDCGGGTCDVTTYKIKSVEPRLEFEELVIGSGDKCGSTFIDREFIAWMEDKFGEHYTSLSSEKRGPASKFMREFETHKRDFGKYSDPAIYYEMLLVMKHAPDSRYYDSEACTVKIYETQLKSFFRPVVDKIIRLLKGQLDDDLARNSVRTIKTVILVGGFGDSRYLNNAVRNFCLENDLRPICPPHPQAAIVRGAALTGLLNLRPTSRKARRHYGFSVSETFDPDKHRSKDKYICKWSGKEKAAGNMRWKLPKGSNVDETTNISYEIWKARSRSKLGLQSFHVYVCDDDQAPLLERDPAVKKLVSIAVDLGKIDLSKTKSKWVEDKEMYKIDLEYKIEFGQRQGVLRFRVMFDGGEIGNRTVTFDGDSTYGALQDYGDVNDEACACQ